VNALDKLTYLVSYADTDWLDAHFDLDAGPDDIARTIHGEIRGEVLREAASIAATFLGRFPDWDAMKAAGIIGPHTMARAIGDELRRMADAGQVGTVTAPSGETTQPASFFQPDHTYTRQHHGHLIEFRVEHVATAPGGSYPIAFGWRREPCISAWAPEDSDDLDGWTDITREGEPTQPAPRTERSYWQAIADTLNASAAAGMHVGIDIDGTLTDHTAWSVIWDRRTEQWAVAGYENYADHGSIEDAHSATELYEMDRDAEFRLDAEDDARNTDAVEADERGDA
jgi:hypothetical protein